MPAEEGRFLEGELQGSQGSQSCTPTEGSPLQPPSWPSRTLELPFQVPEGNQRGRKQHFKLKSLKAISQQWRNSPLFLYALQSPQCTVTRHSKSLDVGQASEQFRWQRICYGASSPTYSRNMSFPPPHWGRNRTDDSSEQMHCPTAGSKAVAKYGDCMSQLIPQALGGASRSPGPHSVGNAGGSGSRAAREPTPPNFTPTVTSPQGSHSPQVIQEV